MPTSPFEVVSNLFAPLYLNVSFASSFSYASKEESFILATEMVT